MSCKDREAQRQIRKFEEFFQQNFDHLCMNLSYHANREITVYCHRDEALNEVTTFQQKCIAYLLENRFVTDGNSYVRSEREYTIRWFIGSPIKTPLSSYTKRGTWHCDLLVEVSDVIAC